MSRFVILDHEHGNAGGDGEHPPCHKYRVAFWLPTPASLLPIARARKPIKVFIASRGSSHSHGFYFSNVEGRPCAGCPGGKEPLTHVWDASEDDKAAIQGGEILEFVVDEAGGQISHALSDEEALAALGVVYRELEGSLAEVASRAQARQKRLIGRQVPVGGR